jgi:hypothetical protein
MKEKEECG